MRKIELVEYIKSSYYIEFEEYSGRISEVIYVEEQIQQLKQGNRPRFCSMRELQMIVGSYDRCTELQLLKDASK